MDTLSRGETGNITGQTLSENIDNWEVLSTDNRQSDTTSKKFCDCSNTTQLAIAIATLMVFVFVVVFVIFTSTMQIKTNEIVDFVNGSHPLMYNKTKL